MNIFDKKTVRDALPYNQLIEALRKAFMEDVIVPHRTHHVIENKGESDASLLLMPAWNKLENVGIKIVSVFPDNTKNNLGSVNASYFVMDRKTGIPKAVIDGTELTLRRTAAASALASSYLSNPDAETLLMVGTGRLASYMIEAHMAARDIKNILVWGRREEAALELVSALSPKIKSIECRRDLKSAVDESDIISCATLAKEPLIMGEWLRDGQHIDLVGAFTPDMHEVDGVALEKARVIVDTYFGALAESGEIIDAIKEGFISESDIVADLKELVCDDKIGRRNTTDITLFKSVGTALEDLAAATLILQNA